MSTAVSLMRAVSGSSPYCLRLRASSALYLWMMSTLSSWYLRDGRDRARFAFASPASERGRRSLLRRRNEGGVRVSGVGTRAAFASPALGTRAAFASPTPQESAQTGFVSPRWRISDAVPVLAEAHEHDVAGRHPDLFAHLPADVPQPRHAVEAVALAAAVAEHADDLKRLHANESRHRRGHDESRHRRGHDVDIPRGQIGCEATAPANRCRRDH